MSTLYIMSGLPFSGKTTISKKIADVLGIKRISFDEVWNETKNIPGKNEIEKWKFISQKCEDLIVDELNNNRSVVYDNLGDRPNNRDKMRQLAITNKANFKIIYINISKEESIKRQLENITKQDHHLVSDKNFNNALLNFEIPSPSENPIIFNPSQDIDDWIHINLV